MVVGLLLGLYPSNPDASKMPPAHGRAQTLFYTFRAGCLRSPAPKWTDGLASVQLHTAHRSRLSLTTSTFPDPRGGI